MLPGVRLLLLLLCCLLLPLLQRGCGDADYGDLRDEGHYLYLDEDGSGWGSAGPLEVLGGPARCQDTYPDWISLYCWAPFHATLMATPEGSRCRWDQISSAYSELSGCTQLLAQLLSCPWPSAGLDAFFLQPPSRSAEPGEGLKPQQAAAQPLAAPAPARGWQQPPSLPAPGTEEWDEGEGDRAEWGGGSGHPWGGSRTRGTGGGWAWGSRYLRLPWGWGGTGRRVLGSGVLTLHGPSPFLGTPGWGLAGSTRDAGLGEGSPGLGWRPPSGPCPSPPDAPEGAAGLAPGPL
ncbi:uncharacterized protein LOC141953573 [Strix uralensis]|uniref:uncharacterized protein LOC141953573 n=1 Tax=Strix uralensis TaxID=36305 RepID=UPI003DA7362F